MVSLQKAVLFGGIVWFVIAIIENVLIATSFASVTDTELLVIPIALIVIILASFEYLKEIHAQYEVEGLELATVWFVESIILEALIFGLFYGRGFSHFTSIGLWLTTGFKFIFPLASGIYLQHTMTE